MIWILDPAESFSQDRWVFNLIQTDSEIQLIANGLYTTIGAVGGYILIEAVLGFKNLDLLTKFAFYYIIQTLHFMRVSPSGKAVPSQGTIRGFESHHPLSLAHTIA